eukprot:CAMPEP_0119076668 /NCGR_PEP_ID=MMETSP1178-20130426/88897_1 /TAXON_ID=33656 /ORGANISM="unid sp, Strain CCMP2000" /LENGTH=69 /DNA_ID=CAMNT_0007058971 /DNA_START=141 /DNA_END=347 /DNA_ORIENTATION=+
MRHTGVRPKEDKPVIERRHVLQTALCAAREAQVQPELAAHLGSPLRVGVDDRGELAQLLPGVVGVPHVA